MQHDNVTLEDCCKFFLSKSFYIYCLNIIIFQNIGILELDEVIQLCNKSLTEVEIVINEFYEGLLHFKKVSPI